MSEEINGLSRRATLAAVMGLAAAPAVSRAATPAPGKGVWAAVDAAAGKLVAARLAPGVTLAVTRKGQVVYSKGYGAANLETGAAMSPAAVCRIGSVSKQFCAAAILKLQEQGKLTVQDRLSRFLPEVERAGDVTLAQMLSHTAGIGNYTEGKDPNVFLQRARIDYPSAELLAAMIAQTKPMFIAEPGTKWEYSNTAFVLLGLVVEKAAGEPYAAALDRLVLQPAGLKLTAVDDAAEVVLNRASGYTPNAKAPSGFDNASFISMTYPGAAGALRSTPEDLCRWHTALFGGKVISAESLKAMTTPARLANGQLPTVPTGPKPDAPTRTVEYGFGIGTQHDAHGDSLAHGGGIQGFGSMIATYPAAGVSLSYIVNCDGGFAGDTGLQAAMKAVRDAMVAAAFA